MLSNFPSRKDVERIKQQYPKGSRVELLKLNDDPYAHIPTHTNGTVRLVDDIGTVHVSWDGYGNLGMVYGVDEIRLL